MLVSAHQICYNTIRKTDDARKEDKGGGAMRILVVVDMQNDFVTISGTEFPNLLEFLFFSHLLNKIFFLKVLESIKKIN